MRKLWGGAFRKATDEIAWEFGRSVAGDLTLWEEEIEVSIVHAQMLGRVGTLSSDEATDITRALTDIRAAGPEAVDELAQQCEDIHDLVERALYDRVGAIAGKLHTGRSRNDLIAASTCLWLRRRCDELITDINALQRALLDRAESHLDDLLPGYTHMQRAQPITLGFHLLAHFWMLQRDVDRMRFVKDACSACPLGSAALAGTSFPLDRQFVASELGFDAPTQNALDTVSNRDFVADAIHACAMLLQHLSRLAHEFVLWSTQEYGFVTLDEAYSTGSSIMPQKRNPDFAELIRGRASRAIANWTQLMATMKGLPLGYNRDQQDDKPPLFESVVLAFECLRLMEGMVTTAVWNLAKMKAACEGGFTGATALADALAARGVPFREAHEIVGGLIRQCEEKGLALQDLERDALRELLPDWDLDLQSVLDPSAQVAARQTYGGTGEVRQQLKRAREILGESERGSQRDSVK